MTELAAVSLSCFGVELLPALRFWPGAGGTGEPGGIKEAGSARPATDKAAANPPESCCPAEAADKRDVGGAAAVAAEEMVTGAEKACQEPLCGGNLFNRMERANVMLKF